MIKSLLEYLENKVDAITEIVVNQACKKFERYRQASEIEILNIQQTIRTQIIIVLRRLSGKKIDKKALQATLIALAERRARQGYPLSEILGIVQLIKNQFFKYMETALQENSEITASEFSTVMIESNAHFHRLDLGLIEPYQQFQDNIIQTQQSFLKHKFTSLFRLIEAITNNLNIQEFCEILLDYLCRFYDVKVSVVLLLDENKNELYPQHATGMSRRYKHETRFSVNAPPFKKYIQEGHAVHAMDTPFHVDQLSASLPLATENTLLENSMPSKKHGVKRDNQTEHPMCSSLYAPMIGRQRTYGVVALHCLKQRRFSQNEIQQFETLARIAAVALENARFYQNLIEEKGKIDAIVNSITDGLVLIDFHEEIVFINDQASRYFQQPAYRLMGASASILPERLLANAKEPHILQSAYLRALSTIVEHPVLECTLYRPEIIDIRLSMFPVRDRDNHFIGRGLIIKDITHEKEVNRMKSEFVAIASHTMRTPMTSILGFAGLLLENKMTPEVQKKYIHNIQKESQRLTNILNDMLDLMNIESGKISLKLISVDGVGLVKTVAGKLSGQTQREITILGGDKKMPRLIADKIKIAQVLHNLLMNAVQFSSGKIKTNVKKVNSIRFRPGYYHSTLNLDHPGLFPAVVFSVEDQGAGIPYDQSNAIFEPFHKINKESMRVHEGSGLGLTIARYIIEAHGGKLWVESKPGKGSVFSFALPLELTAVDKNIGPMAT
ncbi:GAF domain-containing protein [bacterium]|nr:GAF domain-containing protein [bacterium]